MLAIITIISINVSSKTSSKNYFDVRGKFHMYVHMCMCTCVYLPMKDHLDDTGSSSPQIHVNGESWVHYHDN